jgi:hypothetical protein
VVLKNVVPALLGAALLVGSGAMAAEYRANEFLSLDLSNAVLSPNPLGPPAQFGPVPVEAKSESKSDSKSESTSDFESEGAAEAAPAPGAQVRKVAAERVSVAHPRVAHFRAEKPRGAARTRLAHRNPLNAQAMDTRIQAWPCKSGGICNWKQ